MMPSTVSEQLMYSTVRLTTATGTGTGSFFRFQFEDKYVPIIITNKHVINGNPQEIVSFDLHLKNENNEPDGNQSCTFSTTWYFHDTKDLCYCFVADLFNQVKKITGKEVFYRALDENFLPTNEELMDLDAIESLVMVGYPIGLFDQKNNLPIFRRGYSASHPGIDFNEDGIGLADIPCFPGSSGSPILILDEGSYLDKKKGGLMIGSSRVKLLGYLYAGPQYSATGEIQIRTIPTSNPKIGIATPLLINLGYYVKSIVLQEFKKQIKEKLHK